MSVKDALLGSLESGDGFVSGAWLAARLGVSRAAVWKQVALLRSQGYVIESIRGKGYKLLGRPDTVTERELGRHLVTELFGRRLIAVATTGSTNDLAADAARGGAPEGTVVIAEAQTAGRGRLGRAWQSEPGLNLYMSVLLRPELGPAEAPRLSLLAGVAVAEALETEGLEVAIKWPNDVLVGRRKIAGILTEMEAEADRVRAVVVGIGVNLNSTEDDFLPELRDKATSVLIESGRRADRPAFAARLLESFERHYRNFSRQGLAAVAADWNRRSCLDGQRVRVAQAGTTVEGLCVGIDSDGALLVKQGDGEPRRVVAGDVSLEGYYES